MSELPSIVEAVRAHAARGCSSTLRFGRGTEPIDYAGLVRQVEARVDRLEHAGFLPGQRVALSMSNTLDTVAAALAVMSASGTIVPMFHRPGMRAAGKDYARIVATLRVSRADWAFTHAVDLPVLAEAAAASGCRAVIETYEQLASPLGWRCEPGARVEAGSCVGSEMFPALIQFSAGSTSEPKGLCLGHDQLASNVRAICQRTDFTDQERVCSWLPLFHDMGLIGALFVTLYGGASLCLFSPMEFLRNPLGWIEQLSADRSTVTQAPQFAYDLCLRKAALEGLPAHAYDLSALRFALNGAEAVDATRCDEFERVFGVYGLRPNVVQPCYGLAENCVAVTIRVPGTPRVSLHFERAALSSGYVQPLAQPSPTSVTRSANGSPLDGTALCVLDREGRCVGEGQVGELAISGRATTTGILQADGAIAPLPEWVRTGDLGLIADGELYIVGRVKEVVKRGGETFSPTDIENRVGASFASATLPEILGVAAFGYRDEVSGAEEIVVVLETRAFRDAQRTASLDAHVRQVLLREFRVPLRDVIIVKPGTLSRTTSGKLQRLTLRERYLQGELVSREPERRVQQV